MYMDEKITTKFGERLESSPLFPRYTLQKQ